ncbi:hypothetical protein BDN71DRAFT_1508452 [Pleurotus eryngii]|uniref:Uncharacterized protein n=1 Tax=Pleurotus eryngii TaxID=5323 RepID=A0A9P5ZUP1_PLEER|nr:hypothetical protein BDN71DRAFT_1508452 [Pleurotus eryngii]
MVTDKFGFEFTPHGVVPSLDPKLYSIDKQEAAFFKSMTCIQDDEELKKHILDVQAKAYIGYPFTPLFGHSDHQNPLGSALEV